MLVFCFPRDFDFFGETQLKKMHDFCFTIPYGLILGVGGLIGYLRKGSTSSLAGGLGTGFLLILAGYISLKAFGRKKNSYLALILETGMYLFIYFISKYYYDFF